MDRNPQVSIEIFGMHGITANTNHVKMPITDRTTVSDAIDYIVRKYPGIVIDKDAILIAVNHEIVPPTTMLKDNDTVSLLPPIGGG